MWVKAPAAKLSPVAKEDVAGLERVLAASIVGEPLTINVGPVWLVVNLESADAVAKVEPDMQAIAALSHAAGITGITVFGAATGDGSALHVRSFAPAHGVPEDPVCGSGNVSVAAYVARSGLLGRFGTRYVARQGMQLGRDGRVDLRIEGDDVYLGGSAVTCVEGSLRAE